jgi:hypothetical protein
MKTRYRHIRFVQDGHHWFCLTNLDANLIGFCEFSEKRQCWLFVSSTRIALTSHWCRDIATFLDRLPKP